jgi:hypothetical protein
MLVVVSSTPPAPPRPLLPREHGAYGQLLFPTLTALILAPRAPACLLAVAGVAAFFAHEPALILLGHRGPRAQRDDGPRARRWLLALASLAIGTGLAGLGLAPPAARWGVAIPGALALLLAPLIVARREKTTVGELLAALGLTSLAVPVGLGRGLAPSTTAALAGTFGLFFATATLAVRGLLGRGSRWLPGAALALSGAIVGAMALAVSSWPGAPWPLGRLPWALVPSVIVGLVLLLWPPPPGQLRRVGWSLMGGALVTTLLLVAILR